MINNMPEICRFYGIILYLYWRDHNPPHIHFTYGEYVCHIRIIDRVVDGKAPAKVIALVNKWIDEHEAELLSLWEKAVKGLTRETIEWANGADFAPEFLYDIGTAQ